MRVPLTLVAVLAAGPLSAGVEEALSDDILPGYANFAAATDALSAAAAQDCRAQSLDPAYQAAFDAWMPVADMHLGPAESGTLGIAFWPDERGAGPKTLSALIAANDPVGTDATLYADVSIAARGLFALDLLLYDGDFVYVDGSYTCTLVQTVTADLAIQAAALNAGWQDHATLMRTAGAAGNTTYLEATEVEQAIYTQILGSLTMTQDNRLGRPMGTFDRPRPTRAEAWRSGRPLANAVGAVTGAYALASDIATGPTPLSNAAFAAVGDAAARISDPTFQDIDDPQARLRVEVLQQRVKALKDAIEDELGLASGFNSADGD